MASRCPQATSRDIHEPTAASIPDQYQGRLAGPFQATSASPRLMDSHNPDCPDFGQKRREAVLSLPPPASRDDLSEGEAGTRERIAHGGDEAADMEHRRESLVAAHAAVALLDPPADGCASLLVSHIRYVIL